MSADKHPAEVLADLYDQAATEFGSEMAAKVADMLRRIPALEAERDAYRARLDRAIAAAEEQFGEDATRYKLSLFQNGRARNVFPQSMGGKWFAFQRADNDAHVGLSLRVVEAKAERDQLRAELEALRADAERLDWLADPANTIGNVQLPRECVEQNLHSLRDAIDAARKQQ